MFSTKSIAAAALSAVALTGVCAQSAAADSISYIKGGDVWLSTPDGSRQFQVTTTGGYSSASQADNGTIVALKGQRIHKLDRLGNVQADFPTAVSDGTDDTTLPYASHFRGPYDLDLSPDGTKVAYNWYWQYWYTSGYFGYHELRHGVGVSSVDRTTSWSDPGAGYQTGWRDSAWYDDDTLVYGKKAKHGMVDIAVNEVGRQNTGSMNWFKSDAGTLLDLRAPAVNSDRSLVAVVGDAAGANPFPAGEQLWTVATDGDPPADPAGFCNGYFEPNGGKFLSPTFSPDGRSLAWEEGDGVHAAGDQGTCKGEADNAKLIIPGAKDPDWSAADVPSSRPGKEQQQQPNNGGTGTQTAPKANETVRPADTNVPKPDPKPTVRDEVAPALTMSFACRSACTVSGKVLAPKKIARKLGLGGAALATGKVRRTAKGSAKLELRLTAQGQKVLAKVGGKKLTLQVSIKEGAKTRRLSKRVVLR